MADRTETRNWYRVNQDRAFTVLIWLVAAAVAGVFFWILFDVVVGGVSKVNWEFVSTAPSEAGREGGILPMIVSTLSILGVALCVAIPFALASAVFLAEFTRRTGWLATIISRSLDVLAAVPSIVFGLFGNAFFCVWLGMGYSIMAGGLTLACMILPILIRSLETGFRQVPLDYRVAATALGMTRTRTVFSILLPRAYPGLVVGLVLGIGRVMAETAALLFTSGFVDRMPGTLWDSGRSLSIHIYDLAMNVPGGEANAYGTAVVLLLLLLVINGSAVFLSDWWLKRIGHDYE